MIFGKIDYINLLPFSVYIKKKIKSSRIKKAIDYKKAPPSIINEKFRKREVNFAFISSIKSNKRSIRCLDIGIVAKKEIKSVLIDRENIGIDPHSASSNALAKILDLTGKVIIGDKALRAYCQESFKYIDLAKVWYDKNKLPFVFARLCFNKKSNYFLKISKDFVSKKVKIPMYILSKYSKERGIDKKVISDYLDLIEYKIDNKAKLSLKKFFKAVKKCKN